MSDCPFCHGEPETGSTGSPVSSQGTGDSQNAGRRPGFLRRVRACMQWLGPALLVVLTPKCPMCVIGYIAFFTGVGVSVSTARWIQILMPVLGVTLLGYLVIRLLLRVGRRRMMIPH